MIAGQGALMERENGGVRKVRVQFGIRKFGTVERHPSRGVKRLWGLNPNVINMDTPKMAERTVHQYGFL